MSMVTVAGYGVVSDYRSLYKKLQKDESIKNGLISFFRRHPFEVKIFDAENFLARVAAMHFPDLDVEVGGETALQRAAEDLNTINDYYTSELEEFLEHPDDGYEDEDGEVRSMVDEYAAQVLRCTNAILLLIGAGARKGRGIRRICYVTRDMLNEFKKTIPAFNRLLGMVR